MEHGAERPEDAGPVGALVEVVANPVALLSVVGKPAHPAPPGTVWGIGLDSASAASQLVELQGRQAADGEQAAADPPVRTARGMNRRRRDHIPVVGLDNLAGANQVAGRGLAPVRERVALAERDGGQDAGGLPAGGHAVEADPGDTVVAAGGPRGFRQLPEPGFQFPPGGLTFGGRVVLGRVVVEVEVDADHAVRQAKRDVARRVRPDPSDGPAQGRPSARLPRSILSAGATSRRAVAAAVSSQRRGMLARRCGRTVLSCRRPPSAWAGTTSQSEHRSTRFHRIAIAMASRNSVRSHPRMESSSSSRTSPCLSDDLRHAPGKADGGRSGAHAAPPETGLRR